MENIAKLTSYGCYLDCDFATARYPDDKIHIVGLLAEYVYDLEQRILHYDERYAKLWREIETLRECVSKESDQEQKISDLEAKLAESEKDRLMWQEMYKSADKQNKEICETDIYPLQEQVQQLKQQLAEKERLLRKYVATGCPIHQDKISFAVYELSLVNGMLTDAIIEITQNETDVNKLYYLEKIAKKFAEKTGERIRQLKEME